MTELAPGFQPTQFGEFGQTPDLAARIELARSSAVPIETGSWSNPVPAAGFEDHPFFNPSLSELSSLDDETVIPLGGGNPDPTTTNTVSVESAEEYRLLLRQAIGLPVDGSVGNSYLESLVDRMHDEQMDRAALVNAIAPQANVRHTINFFKSDNQDGTWVTSFIPSLFITGDLPKIDIAAILASSTSQTKPAPASLDAISRMGYTSPEDVSERFRATRLAEVHDAMQRGFLHGMLLEPETVASESAQGSGDRPDRIKDILPNPSSAS